MAAPAAGMGAALAGAIAAAPGTQLVIGSGAAAHGAQVVIGSGGDRRRLRDGADFVRLVTPFAHVTGGDWRRAGLRAGSACRAGPARGAASGWSPPPWKFSGYRPVT